MAFLNRNNSLLFFGCLIITGFCSCKDKSKSTKTAKPNPPTIVDVIIATPEPMSNIIEANGTVVANEYVELHPEVSGRLTYLKVAEGSHVEQGTVIAKINDADLRAQLNKSKVQLELAETTVSRYKQLLDVNGINQSDYDLAVNQVNGYKADIQYTQSLIDKTVIRAPFTGVAGLRQVSPGAYVTPATVIATLQQVSQVKIDFTLPEAYGNIIKTGMLIDVALDINTSKKEKAMIVAMEPGANTDTRNIKVRAVLQNTVVNPGAFVKVYIDEGKERSSILVPTNAIIPDDKNNQVIIIKNGIANFVNVQTGNRLTNNVEILSGLKQGDSIVVTGVLFVRPKAKVKVRGVKKLDMAVNDSTQKVTDQ
ncbi:MAG: efflux RND transporter periplasmic adaptor subunit [Ferruginibacter sp.]